MAMLKASFAKTKIRICLDGGFANPELLDYLEMEEVEYVLGMASNARLLKRARRLMGKARIKSRTTGATEDVFGDTLYAAKKWSHRRRIIIKAEVAREDGRKPRDNPRFVIQIRKSFLASLMPIHELIGLTQTLLSRVAFRPEQSTNPALSNVNLFIIGFARFKRWRKLETILKFDLGAGRGRDAPDGSEDSRYRYSPSLGHGGHCQASGLRVCLGQTKREPPDPARQHLQPLLLVDCQSGRRCAADLPPTRGDRSHPYFD
ncbi:MAG: transposase [Acidobacteriia bacterium]|nr:transposase [Terriglobia bacterium]